MQRQTEVKIKYSCRKLRREKSSLKIGDINYQPASHPVKSGTSGMVRKFLSDSTNNAVAVKAPIRHIKSHAIIDPKQFCVSTQPDHVTIQKYLVDRESKFLKMAYPDKLAQPLHLHYSIKQKDYYSWRLLMSFAPGKSLDDTLASPKSRVEMLTLLLAIAHELKRIHELGIIHGDVKAQNILIDEENNVQFVDFGDAYFTTEKYAIIYSNMCSYTAPERLCHSDPTHPVAPDTNQDVYSLASTFIWAVETWLANLGIESEEAKRQFPKAFKFFSRCRDANPDKRPTLDDIISKLEDEKAKPGIFGNCPIL